MALLVHINTGVTDLELNTSNTEFTEVSPDNDFIVYSAGNDQVIDGADIPSQSELISAGVRWTGSQIVVDKYFLADIDANLLKEINLAGNQDTRYVFAVDFDSATASEPVLEVWDDENLNTMANTMLGGGTPSSSWIRGITTTSSSPGAGWATSADRLAGSTDGNFLLLNDGNGALPSADTLYFNLCVIVPASASNSGFSNTPVYAIKWLEN